MKDQYMVKHNAISKMLKINIVQNIMISTFSSTLHYFITYIIFIHIIFINIRISFPDLTRLIIKVATMLIFQQ